MCESNQGSLRTFVSPFDMPRSFRSSDGSKHREPADGMPVVVVEPSRGDPRRSIVSISSWAPVSHVDSRNFNPSHRTSKAKTQGR